MPNSDEIILLWSGCSKCITSEGISNDVGRNVGHLRMIHEGFA